MLLVDAVDVGAALVAVVTVASLRLVVGGRSSPDCSEKPRRAIRRFYVGKWPVFLGCPGQLTGAGTAQTARVVLLKQGEIVQVLRSSNRLVRKSGFQAHPMPVVGDRRRPRFRNPGRGGRRSRNAGYGSP